MSFQPALGGFLQCSLWLLFGAVVIASAEECDKTQCNGPLRYYKDLQCKPIYEKSGDCCAIAYDCSHLNGRSAEKCYANGHEYNIGDRLRDEDVINPCDKIGCFCSKGRKGVAQFSCPVVDCFPKEAKPGCYLRRTGDSCCGTEEVCPENPDERPKCDVDGHTYLDGEGFIPNSEPDVWCQCLEGYEGKNVAPFCRKGSCGAEQQRSWEIRENCAPIYDLNQSSIKSCNSFYRCQIVSDVVIHPEHKESHKIENKLCKFGNLTLHVGDELNQSTGFPTKCVKCKCEVPPVLTCKRLSNEECEIKYPPQA